MRTCPRRGCGFTGVAHALVELPASVLARAEHFQASRAEHPQGSPSHTPHAFWFEHFAETDPHGAPPGGVWRCSGEMF